MRLDAFHATYERGRSCTILQSAYRLQGGIRQPAAAAGSKACSCEAILMPVAPVKSLALPRSFWHNDQLAVILSGLEAPSAGAAVSVVP